ncbi:MAG: succinate dehydrogenase, hydrophobic membrane anchor protein [Thioalkalispiraceae bacterium]|jgi:succinate dehydrogenase / fumarate reductase membrane anchor subunit
MSWRAQGMRTWLLQRLTAIYMLLYAISFSIYFINQAVDDFISWQRLFVHPVANIATLIFFFSILYHAWVGVRDILIDYIKWSALRFFLWTIVTALLIGLGVWVSMILYSVVRV